MKKNLKRLISTIVMLSMMITLLTGFSATASAAVEGDESNGAFNFCVIDNKFSEININALKCDWADGTTVLPPAPWTIKTSTGGYSDGNAPAVRASYKNIGGSAPYLKGLWTLDDTFGAPFNLKQIELTDNSYLSGNFAVELKYIPYKITQYPDKNNNWFGAVANANQGFISIGVAKHKYDGQSNSYGEMYWNFGSENDTNFPIGILANPCDKNTGAQAGYGQYTMKYNYASGSGVSPTIPATTEELPEDFNGYHYARIEFTTDNGITVLTRRGENTPWKKATPTSGLDTIMNQLRIPESNNKLIFRLHKGIIGVDSVKVYKMRSEVDNSDARFDVKVIDRKFSEININALKCDWADGTTVLPPAPWTIKTSTGGYSDGNAPAVRASYKNIGGAAPYLKGLWTLDDTFGAPFNLKQIELTDNGYLSGNFAVELKYIPYKITQYPEKNNNWFGAVANANQGFISIGVAKHKYDGQSNSYGEMYWNFGSENDTNFPIGILTNPCDKNTGAQAGYGQYTMKYNYANGSGVSPTIPSTTEELPGDFNGYHYARIEFTTDNGITVLTRRGENTPWKKATPTNGLDTIMNQLRIPESNNKLIFRLHKGFIGVDSVKVYKFASDLENSVDSFEFTEDAEGLKATATLTNNNKADGWKVMLVTAIYNGNELVSVEVTPDTIAMGTQKTISTPVDTSKYQEGYEIKAFLWEADSLIPLSGVLPLEQ